MMQQRYSFPSILLVALVLFLTCNVVRSFQVVGPRSLGTPWAPSQTTTMATAETTTLSRSTSRAVASTPDDNNEKLPLPLTTNDNSDMLKEGTIKVALGIVASLVVYNLFSFISVGAALRDASASVGSAVDATIQDASQAMTSAVDMTIVTPLRDAVDAPLSALKGATDGVTSTFQDMADGPALSVQSVLPFKAF